jgi:3-methylfumaryl-CoA hydratase
MTMNETPTIDIDRLHSWIGREEVAYDTVSTELVRKFNATLNIASEKPEEGQVAPLLVNYCLGQSIVHTDDLGEDGHPRKGGFLPPVPLPRRMWAGSNLTFHRDLHVGEVVRRVSRIDDVTVKEGRSGLLCFVTVQHRLDVGGLLAIEERQDIVYREAAIGPVPKPMIASDPLPSDTHRRMIAPAAPLLFRYSALTFNSHRIHYDRDYATQVEYYPGLVVHGPLQATLLLHLARDLKGRTPTRFTFRGLSPLFDDDRINLHAKEEGVVMKLWTMRDTGPVAMSAEAIWS